MNGSSLEPLGSAAGSHQPAPGLAAANFGATSSASNDSAGDRLDQLSATVSSALEAAQLKYGQQHEVEQQKVREEEEDLKSKRAEKFHLHHHRSASAAAAAAAAAVSMMLSKGPEGQYYVFDNITLRVCRDVLRPVGVDRCTLIDYVDDCANDEGIIDYVAFFFCAFSPDKMPLALIISVSLTFISKFSSNYLASKTNLQIFRKDPLAADAFRGHRSDGDRFVSFFSRKRQAQE